MDTDFNTGRLPTPPLANPRGWTLHPSSAPRAELVREEWSDEDPQVRLGGNERKKGAGSLRMVVRQTCRLW